MRMLLAVAAVSGTFAAVVFAPDPSAAQSPQSYPYCALDSSSGATSCYYSSRAQCGTKCIPNPSYGGGSSAMASERGRDRFPRR